MRNLLCALALAIGSIAATGCQPGAPERAAPLAAVSPEPRPSIEAPVASIVPTGTVNAGAQIRVIFQDDVIPLAQLEGPDETAVLAKFAIAPALPGHFRMLTPRMVGFESDVALPPAMRVRVTIAKGLRDLHGRTLAHDLRWTFETAPIAITDLPLQKDAKGEPPPGLLSAPVSLSSNVQLDVASLAAHASLVPADGGGAVPLAVPTDSPQGATAAPSDDTIDSDHPFRYVLRPVQTLAKATSYAVVIAPGVMPKAGNLPSAATFKGRLRTYGTLHLLGVVPDERDDAPRRFDSGVPMLAFDNPIDPKSLAAIRIEPAPAAGTLLGVFGGTTVGVNPALLQPNTGYTVTIGAALTDTFGQRLGSDERATFRTTDRTAFVWAPKGTHLLPASADVRLNIAAINLPNGAAQATFRRVEPGDVVRYDDPLDVDALFPGSSWSPLPTAGAANVERTIEIPLRERLGGRTGVLQYGITGPRGIAGGSRARPKTGDDTFAGIAQLTNLGVFAQYFPDAGRVRVDRLSDGSPVAGAQVEVFHAKGHEPCASTRTGADGIARLAGAAFAACAALDGGKNEAPALVTIVRSGADWTYVRTADLGEPYDVDNSWSSATPISRATMFSDRNLYQPGETVQLTAVGWFLTHGALARGRAPNYGVQLVAPHGEKRDLPRLQLNAFGTATIAIALPKNAALGYYQVHATAGNGEEIYGDFRVAEFKPPNFRVDLALDVLAAVAGATVHATTTSTYLFGAPVQGATTAYAVTRRVADYSWESDRDYTFGRHWFWPEREPAIGTDVVQAPVAVDATGKAALPIVIAGDLPYPMEYRVDAETTDVANIAVGDAKTFTAFPGPALIGLKTDFVATSGAPAKVSVVAIDPQGKLASGVDVHLELQAATYDRATRVVEGSESLETAVTYTTVAGTDVKTAANAVVAMLTPPAAGTYRIRANVAGAKSDATETDVQLFVAGEGEARWGAQDPNHLAIHLDKTTYRPGETARAVIESPFPDADVSVAVVRSGVLWEQRIRTHGAAPTVTFTVMPEMLPNAAFQAVAVRRGPLPRDAGPDAGNALSRTGFAGFDVALDGKYVRVRAAAERATLGPAARQSVRVRSTDARGRPLRTQITLIVVNDAVLQLSGYRPPDLVKLVYAQQPISTRYADNRRNVVLRTLRKSEEKGWGFGGGLSTGAADTRIRRKFEPLAYYGGALLSDANGELTASFTLPDDLTTWRVMAVAATTDGRFGNGETTFLTTKPLIVNPVLPQIARPGDRFAGGVAVTNTSGASGTLSIAGMLGAPLGFLADGRPSERIALSAPLERITQAFRFPIAAAGMGTSTATFTVAANGARDGFAIPVAVIDRAVTESVIVTGVTAASAAVPLEVAATTPTDTGGLEIVLANSLMPAAIVAARSALVGDDAVALSAAGRLTIAADVLRLQALTQSTGPAVDPRPVALRELANLAALQRPDGGFASYRGAPASDPYDSLEVLHAFARARTAGIAVNGGAWTRAQAFAVRVLADPAAWSWCKRDPCKSELRLHALDALADAGDRRTTFAGEIDAMRDQLSLADRLRLARYLLLTPGYEARGAELAGQLAQRVYETGALATFNAPERYRWFAQPVATQALATRLFVAQHAGPLLIDGLTRSLLALRRNGSWGCTCQDALALDALVDVATAAGRPGSFVATARLGSATPVRANFAGNAASVTADVAPAQLPRGRSTVALAKSGSGTLHYAVTYRYRLAGAQPGRINGLRITRIVRPAGAATELARMGLVAPAEPVTLAAGKVFDLELRIFVDHPVDRVRIVDPLPAGMEAVDTAFATNLTSVAAMPLGDAWAIDDQQIRFDRVEAYADRLGPGAYSMHVLVRTVTPGTFAWPGAQTYLIGRPEEFGRTAATTVTIK